MSTMHADATDPGSGPAPSPPVRSGVRATGVLLAAGAGTRMGRPKALVSDPLTGEPWLLRGIRALVDGGCSAVVVVLGARATEARELLATTVGGSPAGGIRVAPSTTTITVIEAPDWHDGLSASLRAGLSSLDPTTIDAALITLVDLPRLPAASVARLLDVASPRTALRQAVYDGRPGHPVLIGADHLAALGASLGGDRGARSYLRAHGAEEVDCTDLGGGDDVDGPRRALRESGTHSP
ncbi:NTP transferase domain-containing protein [Herbiconiux sp. A18JL235]|uniref:NTP transferase domain-containing protein n=1 Tax=Herbiconiux sp. A18JL235 TaxID=3152363 RepID=A0AB39BKC8_9MICO